VNNWRLDQGDKYNQICENDPKQRVVITVEISIMAIPIVLDVKKKVGKKKSAV
jgi:hypothetical protein